MQDFFNLVTLVCAALAAMGLGVFAAYAIFKSGFALMHWHTQQNAPASTVVVKASTEVASVS